MRAGIPRPILYLAGIMLSCISFACHSQSTKPNIILILADDIGAEALGVYGGESYSTPSLDQMAREGVRFEFAHAQPLCTPSRVKIMTGQYNFRNYSHFGYLERGQITFAQVLKSAGYKTAVAGKWQLFNNRFEDIEGSLPEDAGFDEFLLWQVKNEERGSRYWGPRLSHNGALRQHDASAYGPEVINDYVLRLIEQYKSEPFFIYYPMLLPHDPWVTTPAMRDESASDQQKFAAMVAYMDKMVGRVREQVESLGLAENTMIWFIGDNGTGRDIVSRQNGVEVAGAKGSTVNAGSHVPYIVWGPGIAEVPRLSSSLVNLNDVLPTLAELAGAELPEEYPGDGESLLPIFSDGVELQRESMFIHYEPRWPSGVPARYALDRRWKLYESGEFFDTQLDSLETNPLDVQSLTGEGEEAYQRLYAFIESMPGQLQSNRRWLPPQLYPVLAGIGVVLLFGFWLSWKFVKRRRRKK